MRRMMDRALQERIIGAVVLVVFAVLVVPIFLDGPSEDAEIISETVTLPGQNNQVRKQQTIVLERDRSEPVPAAAGAQNVASAGNTSVARETPQVVAEKPAAAAAELETPPAQPSNPAPVAEEPPAVADEVSATGMWAVQLGSFSNQQNAERLAADLRKQGYAAFLSRRETGDGALHRVRIGPQKDREGAEAVAAQLKKGGHQGQVVPHP